MSLQHGNTEESRRELHRYENDMLIIAADLEHLKATERQNAEALRMQKNTVERAKIEIEKLEKEKERIRQDLLAKEADHALLKEKIKSIH
ncbi:MAG: hypothetical protein A2808_00655 [Candidatus Moranbacteria bacterium RIFCSPHIGHO2_01_FULL_55_24]|nr:MAG: hypothetical protein A2808_00655 [Candidatus Moranbacteria bacterium RIFCSPHIGHO2_01_FULL_55_24]